MKIYSKNGSLKWFSLMVFMVFSLESCGEKDVSKEQKPPQNIAELEKAKILFSENGQLQAILYAEKMESKRNIIWAWNINVEFYPKTDSISEGGLVSDSGFVAEGAGRNRTVSVFGNVILEAPDGTKLFADSLRWNPKLGQIESESKVKVIRGKEIINGVGIVSDPNFNRIRVKNVKGTISG